MSDKQLTNCKYDKLSSKKEEAIPRDRFPVDLIGSYKIRREGHDNPLILKALTIIDPETGWLKNSTIITYDPGN